MSAHISDSELERLLSGLANEHTPPASGPAEILTAARSSSADPTHRLAPETGSPLAPVRRSRRFRPRSGRQSALSIAAALVVLALVPSTVGGVLSGNDSLSGTESTAIGGGSSAPDLAYDSGADTTGGAAPGAGFETARGSANSEEVAPVAAPAPGAPTLPGKPSTPGGQVPPPGEKTFLVRTAQLELEVKKGATQATLSKLESLATAAGGYVASSRTDPTGYVAPESEPAPIATEGTLVLRVPVAELDPVLAKARALDAKVVAYGASGTDVTSTVVDQRARLRALEASRDRYVALLAEAENVGEILAVQAKIDEVQASIESLTAQAASLEDQASFATLTVSVRSEDSGFSSYQQRGPWAQAFYEAREGFTGGLRSIVANSGSFTLNLLVLTGLFFLARALYRRWQRSRI